MDLFIDILADAFVDTLHLAPFLFITYVLMEFIEHKAQGKAEGLVSRAGAAAPVVGAAVGAVPQCGFSAAAATLYAGRVISFGTLMAVFLSTSDELLPILIAEQAEVHTMASIVATKFAIGLVMGVALDALARIGSVRRCLHAVAGGLVHDEEHGECERCCCHGTRTSMLSGALVRTLQVLGFVFVVSLALNAVIELVGEESFAAFVGANQFASVFASAAVGLVPNCAASVIITELYLEGVLSAGAMIAGSLVSAGLGLLVLLRANRTLSQNAFVLLCLYGTGVVWGLVISAIGVVF